MGQEFPNVSPWDPCHKVAMAPVDLAEAKQELGFGLAMGWIWMSLDDELGMSWGLGIETTLTTNHMYVYI